MAHEGGAKIAATTVISRRCGGVSQIYQDATRFPGGRCEFLAAEWPAVRSACGYRETLAGSKVTPNMKWGL